MEPFKFKPPAPDMRTPASRPGLPALLLLVLLILPHPGCLFHKKRPPAAATVVTNIAPEVSAEFQRSVTGWNLGDLDKFMELYSDYATFAQRETFIMGKANIRAVYAQAFAGGKGPPKLTLERLDVEELAPGLAIVRGIYRSSRDGAAVGRGTSTLIMRLIDGHWRIIHDHST